MSWKWFCYHLEYWENVFYHLLPASKACFLLLPVFQSTQMHPANVISPIFSLTLCLLTAQWIISLKQYLRGKWFEGKGKPIPNTPCSCIHKKILAHYFLGRVQRTGKQHMVAVFHWKYWEQSGGPQLWCHAIGKKKIPSLKVHLSRVMRQE